ncbi:CDP-glycerol glycerophosphotransferase family protein [Staphylococcus caeli]|uniref:Glycosyl glycerophosphate transferase involved in teichoic acid biosynthesis n=1 Tax=Staphylococcus caeli TaxID=2201815 RepID=A0A1D4L2H3_9STAP|nr:CDP-glycerol glycerophosphotransferase family protein [Staphylococcus caeli]SCS80501.1 glycosyl glycerophosphate transferase involved in teichoic acid biosynthesis [Staphylococcus caeli]SCS93951.1 glycosyl glycerophosphate transferase involved in teichoic acid biosynthesis [Staphylococcus caeli]
MIKQIKMTTIHLLEAQLNKAQQEGYTHFVLTNESIEIYDPMLEAVELKPYTIVADYTVCQQYQNDCTYYGKSNITFNDWIENINHYPNVIFHIETAQSILKQFQINTIFDLAVISLLEDDIVTDSHVVFNFETVMTTSKDIWEDIQNLSPLDTTKFNLNKLAYLHKNSIPFKKNEILQPESMRFIDKCLSHSNFRCPHWIFKGIERHFEKKHQNMSYIYAKDKTKVKNHIVFLGFDYGFRGNSRYLFNYFAKHFTKLPIYFITDDVSGPNFIKPSDPQATTLIETAQVVILESYIPDNLKPNGTIIQLWHGTPIKKLFLDSSEPHQNLNIYNYRARKYNKCLQQDYFVSDCASMIGYFKTAFPQQKTHMLNCGYPRVRYLLDKQSDKPYITFIKHELKLDPNKETLLYAPTWKSTNDTSDLLPISDALLNKYNVIFKGHVEDKANTIPEHAIIAPQHIEVQDLLLVSDIVLTDYSSIIFDALSINKIVCQYTPNHEQYLSERGVYDEVMHALSTVRYSDSKALLNDLISHQMKELNDIDFINKDNHAFETLSHIIHKCTKTK